MRLESGKILHTFKKYRQAELQSNKSAFAKKFFAQLEIK